VSLILIAYCIIEVCLTILLLQSVSTFKNNIINKILEYSFSNVIFVFYSKIECVSLVIIDIFNNAKHVIIQK